MSQTKTESIIASNKEDPFSQDISTICLINLGEEISHVVKISSINNPKDLEWHHYLFPSIVAQVHSKEDAYENCLNLLERIHRIDAKEAIENEDILVGDMAQQYAVYYPNTTLRNLFKKSPIFSNGHVASFNIMESIYSTIFHQLNLHPNQTKIVNITPNTMDDFELLTFEEMLLNKFSIRSFSSLPMCEFMIKTTCKSTGLAVEWKESEITITPILEGEYIQENIYTLNKGKQYILDCLSSIILEEDNHFAQLTEVDQQLILQQIKEQHLSIQSHFPIEKVSFLLTGGKVFEMKLSKNVRSCINGLFETSNKDQERSQSIAEAIVAAILLCPEDCHNELFNNIVLSEELSLIPGFYDCLCQHLTMIIGSHQTFQIIPLEWKEDKLSSHLQTVFSLRKDP